MDLHRLLNVVYSLVSRREKNVKILTPFPIQEMVKNQKIRKYMYIWEKLSILHLVNVEAEIAFVNVCILLNLGIERQSVEVSNIVDIRSVHNREIVMRISSKINSQNRFFTDLNGYQVILSKITLMVVFVGSFCSWIYVVYTGMYMFMCVIL